MILLLTTNALCWLADAPIMETFLLLSWLEHHVHKFRAVLSYHVAITMQDPFKLTAFQWTNSVLILLH